MHVDVICTKASKRLYALQLLKRSALPDLVLVNVYRTCVSPILEYACEAWHSFLPTYLSDQIEWVQRIALPVVYPSFNYSQDMQAARFLPCTNTVATFVNASSVRCLASITHSCHLIILITIIYVAFDPFRFQYVEVIIFIKAFYRLQ